LRRGLGGFRGVEKLTGHFSFFPAVVDSARRCREPLCRGLSPCREGCLGMGHSAWGLHLAILRRDRVGREWVRWLFSVRSISIPGRVRVGHAACCCTRF